MRALSDRRVCALCPAEVKEPFAALCDNTETCRKQKAEHNALVAQEQEQQLRLVKAQKTELRQQSLRAGFQSAEAAAADKAIAKFFYANAVSFTRLGTKNLRWLWGSLGGLGGSWGLEQHLC